ncbi:OB-fold protein [Nigerium massiliense]|uniref:OB-fold protein n=1 Tax=Nigerium massiliense TaxID=1522317 RepID=UPI00059180CA|nr:hypothetical protein [Nigerium massiliense]
MGAVGALVVVVAFVLAMFGGQVAQRAGGAGSAMPAASPAPARAAAAAGQGDAMVVSADDMFDALDADPAAAAERFRGKVVTVAGRVDKVNQAGRTFTIRGSHAYKYHRLVCRSDGHDRTDLRRMRGARHVVAVGTVTEVSAEDGYSLDVSSLTFS